eukprot:3933-Heterococcus_DN1.PRE.2
MACSSGCDNRFEAAAMPAHNNRPLHCVSTAAALSRALRYLRDQKPRGQHCLRGTALRSD